MRRYGQVFALYHRNVVSHFDTIVAQITPPGVGGVAVIRVSGSEAWSVSGLVFDRWPEIPKTRHAVFGRFANGDEGLVLPFDEGHGFTGERSVEYSVHASPASVQSLIEACLASGARRAEPGEFSLRAFLNGRIDLSQAEGVLATVESETEAQLRGANALRGGSLSRIVSLARSELLAVLAEVEARIDFSEELGPLDSVTQMGRLEGVLRTLQQLIGGAEASRLVRNGFRIAIVGPPNAGKSSLLNAFLNQERAIVTPVPGTTRDTIEERLIVNGYPVVLIDTAGLRETDDPVETIGLQRTRLAAAQADAVWYVRDSTTDDPVDWDAPSLIIANKRDLVATDRGPGVPVSTLTRQGMDDLVKWISDQLDETSLSVPVNERHTYCLSQAIGDITEAYSLLRHDGPEDLIASLILSSLESLGRITGETASPEMVSEVFSRFCLGK